jgi:hypothetical protein
VVDLLAIVFGGDSREGSAIIANANHYAGVAPRLAPAKERPVSSEPAREILVIGARALARADGLGPTLEALLGALSTPLGVGSAVVVVPGLASGDLVIVASVGLSDAAAGGLAQAIRNPGHPIARTFADPSATFDVLPTAPGGPALRSHVPLIVTRNGSQTVLGVLALAHEGPLIAVGSLVEAVADLAAVAIERHLREDRPAG